LTSIRHLPNAAAQDFTQFSDATFPAGKHRSQSIADHCLGNDVGLVVAQAPLFRLGGFRTAGASDVDLEHGKPTARVIHRSAETEELRNGFDAR